MADIANEPQGRKALPTSVRWIRNSATSAGAGYLRLPDAPLDSSGATTNASSLLVGVAEALWENLDRDQSTGSSFFGSSRVSPTYLHKGKRRLTSKGWCKPVQAFQREAGGEGWFELAIDCDSPLGASLGHAMLACPGGGTARSRTIRLSN